MSAQLQFDRYFEGHDPVDDPELFLESPEEMGSDALEPLFPTDTPSLSDLVDWVRDSAPGIFEDSDEAGPIEVECLELLPVASLPHEPSVISSTTMVEIGHVRGFSKDFFYAMGTLAIALGVTGLIAYTQNNSSHKEDQSPRPSTPTGQADGSSDFEYEDTPEGLRVEAYREALDRAEDTLQASGAYLIQLYSGHGPERYLVCSDSWDYVVEEGDAKESIARRYHVHWENPQYGRQSVDSFSMELAIEQMNPTSTYAKWGRYSLWAGDKLRLPVDSSCTPVTNEGLFEQAGLPVVENPYNF